MLRNLLEHSLWAGSHMIKWPTQALLWCLGVSLSGLDRTVWRCHAWARAWQPIKPLRRPTADTAQELWMGEDPYVSGLHCEAERSAQSERPEQ